LADVGGPPGAARRHRLPVLLLYGDHDWSRPDERADTARLIPGAEVRTAKNAGHFMSSDAPVETIEQVIELVERRSHS